MTSSENSLLSSTASSSAAATAAAALLSAPLPRLATLLTSGGALAHATLDDERPVNEHDLRSKLVRCVVRARACA